MANRESSRITVAECFACRIWIIANWQYSIASARQLRAVFTNTPSINSLLGTAPSPCGPQQFRPSLGVVNSARRYEEVFLEVSEVVID